MNELDELGIIEKLRMYYSPDVFSKMSGKPSPTIAASDKQRHIYEKTFNDNANVNSISNIVKKLQEDETAESATPAVPTIGTQPVAEELDDLFEVVFFPKISLGPSSVFGDMTWNWLGREYDKEYLTDHIMDDHNIDPGKGIMLVKQKSSQVHPAYHSTEACEIFLNYIPAIERSRCVPILSVNVWTRGDFEGTDAMADTIQSTKVPNLTTLKFLNGEDKVDVDDLTADALMTVSSTTTHAGSITPQMTANDNPATYVSEVSGSAGALKPPIVKSAYVMQKSGMDMFTMPQSLISKKAGHDIDPFRPLMSIKSATISTQSAGQGILAWNTAELVVEVYDRHRLNEVSFLLDPGQYAFTKFELMAGWNHQDKSSPYGKYLNRLVTKELYALKSSSYTFNDAGVVTINLSLAMSGGAEISNTSMFSADADGQGLRDAHKTLLDSLQTIRAGASMVNSQRTGTILPTSVVTQEGGEGGVMVLNQSALTTLKDNISLGNMDSEAREEYNAALASLGEGAENGGALGNYYKLLEEYKEKILTDAMYSDSTGKYRVEFIQAGTLPRASYNGTTWSVYADTDTQYFDPLVGRPTGQEITALDAAYKSNALEQIETQKDGESITFDKLFILAIVKRILAGSPSTADEVHIFIHKFNQACPGLAGEYMGNFRMNKGSIGDRLTKVIETTHNLTISSFMGAIRAEMKDKLNTQFLILSQTQVSQVTTFREELRALKTSLRGLIAQKATKTQAHAEETNEANKTALMTEIEGLNTDIDAKNTAIADKQKQIDDLLETTEQAAQSHQRVANLEMPDLKMLVTTKKSKDVPSKDIMRIHIYDGKSKPNSLQTFLSNLNHEPAINVDELAIGTDDSLAGQDSNQETLTSEMAARNSIVAELIDAGMATVHETVDIYGIPKKRLIVNTQSHHLKKTIKKIMPSITYGVEGTAINKASMSMLSDANIQAHFLLQTQSGVRANIENSSNVNASSSAEKIMPANISLDMMGCPLLRYGQEYFVDFDTNTDLDNVYALTKITHTISPGVFKTTAQLKPTFKGSPAFATLLADIDSLGHSLIESSEETPPATPVPTASTS